MRHVLAWTAACWLAVSALAPSALAWTCAGGIRTSAAPNLPDRCFSVTSFVDTDSDIFGDRCDADFDQNCAINFLDLVTFINPSICWATANPSCDFDTNGSVGVADYTTFRLRYVAGDPFPGE